jgi:hypothetical protein
MDINQQPTKIGASTCSTITGVLWFTGNGRLALVMNSQTRPQEVFHLQMESFLCKTTCFFLFLFKQFQG